MDSRQVCKENLVPAFPGSVVQLLPVLNVLQEGIDVLLPRVPMGIIAPWGSPHTMRTCCRSRLASAARFSQACARLLLLQASTVCLSSHPQGLYSHWLVSCSVACNMGFLDRGLPRSKVCSRPSGLLYILLEHTGASLEHR